MTLSLATALAAALAAVAAVALAGPAHAQSAEAAAGAYLDRIARLNHRGPDLNAVIVANPDAPNQARAAEQAGLPLAGRTVLVKDNIETREWPTTAGSLALEGNMTGRDAPLIAKLRQAGGVVLGKANLSEWANIRSSNSTSGWSAIGGLTKNPFALERSSCGSSSGSGAAVAAGLAWAAIGTETDGSITCPASVNGIVGFKPTVGLVSRTFVVPISHTQDTPGPMAHDVHDAALLLDAIAGSDPADPATALADAHKTDFTQGLASAYVKGVRIGVLRNQVGSNPRVAALFEQALADLEAAGAELVDADYHFERSQWSGELTVELYEFRSALGDYLAHSPGNIEVRSLADVIAFDKAHADTEMRWFGQDLFERAEALTDPGAYEVAHARMLRLARDDGIDELLAKNNVQFLLAPTVGPAWATDLVRGDQWDGTIGAGKLPAVAGYPHLSVPMGAVEGLPVGVSIIGAQWNDAAVLQIGAAYERARTAKLPTSRLKRWKAPIQPSSGNACESARSRSGHHDFRHSCSGNRSLSPR